MSEGNYSFQIRVTGVLLENDKLLLVKQQVHSGRTWSLPGGRLEHGESLEAAIKREMKEETGLSVEPQRLLYVCDVLDAKAPLVHLTFLLRRVEGEIVIPANELDDNPIHDVKMVPTRDLVKYGFSSKFIGLMREGFPNSGNYVGGKAAIGLDT